MPDIPGNSSTTVSVTVGSTTAGSLETTGDHDWYKITLSAGQSITVRVNGVTLEDPYLRIRNASGTVLLENDDIRQGVIRDSQLSFTASSSGTYYLDVAAWDDNYAGDYELFVSPHTPPPLATIDQIANQLVNGYWNGDDRHFAASQGGSITVNISALTSDGRTLAREALGQWSDIIGVNFTEVTFGGKIVFDDDEEGAHADSIWSNGIISSSNVNVSTEWLDKYGTTVGSYAFQTYVHEIGHALGLGHAGHYNGEASYPNDALFANDSWSTSVMSYFSQQENSYFAGLGFTEDYVVTPMLADIVAMSTLYGLSTTTRSGDTTYGFNSNAGRAVFNASVISGVAYTIFDSGGTDTLDYSGYSAVQKINLNSETFSNVGGNIGNVAIARGVIIENAIGGSGNDELIGNAAANTLSGRSGTNIFTGGPSGDTFEDTAANLNGDTITDFTFGDRILFTSASLATFTFSLTGSTLTYNGGSLTLQGAVSGTLVASAAIGGVALSLAAGLGIGDVRNDFNGDGRSDILWRNDTGTLTDWLGTPNGAFSDNYAALSVQVSTGWKVAGTGDFNGDGRDDILWRNDNGALTDWLATANGGFVENFAALSRQVSTDWKVAGTGDFNGDGRDDILWRNDSGALTDWLGTPNGAFSDNYGALSRQVSIGWKVAGIGDFNGDGRDDILWRNDNGALTDWLGTASGGFIENYAALSRNVSTDWKVAGTGDFNGDGRDDILWRNDSGVLTDWLGTPNGAFSDNFAALSRNVTTDWKVAGTGDFNGDGRDDILWRNDNGALTDWLGTPNGAFSDNYAALSRNVTTDWDVQPDYLLG